jgi:hypothetical protein
VNDAQIDTLFSYMTSQNSRIILMGSYITLPEIIKSDRLRRVCTMIHNATEWTLNNQKYVRQTLAEQHKTRWYLMQESTFTIFWAMPKTGKNRSAFRA